MCTKDSERTRGSNPWCTKEKSSSLEEIKFSVYTYILSVWTLRTLTKSNWCNMISFLHNDVELVGSGGKVSYMLPGGARFESRQEHLLSILKFSVDLLSSSGKLTVYYIKFGHYCSVPHLLQLIIIPFVAIWSQLTTVSWNRTQMK
jgi:hypothetical protein